MSQQLGDSAVNLVTASKGTLVGRGGIVDSSSRNEGAGSKNAELGSLQGKIVKCFMCMLSCFSMTL